MDKSFKISDLMKKTLDLVNIGEVFKELHHQLEHGVPPGKTTGWDNFDKFYQFPPFGQLNIVTGQPGCFHKDQLIHTNQGVKPISEIKKGDMVLSYNHKTNVNQFRKVLKTPIHKNHKGKLYKIKMKDGTKIVVTDNHKFYTGTEYVKIGVFKMENEIWKKIPGYGLYEASNMGRIKTYNWKNQKIEAIMKPALDGGGYLRTMLKNDKGITETIKVHRIIAKTFLENKENKETVNHKNGIKNDNRVLNLEWATRSENVKHAFKNFLQTNRGESNPCASLTDLQVVEIRKNYEYGKNCKRGKTKKDWANEYGTSVSVIKKIIEGKTWKHLL